MANIDLTTYTAEQKAELLKKATTELAKRTSGQGVLGSLTQELANRANNGSLDTSKDDELTRSINDNQEKDFAIKSTSDQPEVRSKIEEQIDVEKPEQVDTTKLYEQYTTGELGTQYKTTDLESEIADLEKQIAAEKAVAQERFKSIEDKTVPLGVLSGRLSEVEQQENKRLTALTDRATAVQSQLKTRYGLISNMISYAEKDYETAKAEYDTEYTRAKTAIDETNKLASNEKKDALTTWQTISNLITSGSISYDNLTDTQKLDITKTETKAGLPAGTLELITKGTTGGKVLSTSTVDLEDGKYAYIVKQDTNGSISTQKMYLGKTSKTKEEGVEDNPDKQGIIDDVLAITGTNNFVDTKKIQQVRQNVAIHTPELLNWFDNAYKPANVLDPNDQSARLLITTNEW